MNISVIFIVWVKFCLLPHAECCWQEMLCIMVARGLGKTRQAGRTPLGGQERTERLHPSTLLIGLVTCPSDCWVDSSAPCIQAEQVGGNTSSKSWIGRWEKRGDGKGEISLHFPLSQSSTPQDQPEPDFFQCFLKHPLLVRDREGSRKQAGVKVTSYLPNPSLQSSYARRLTRPSVAF